MTGSAREAFFHFLDACFQALPKDALSSMRKKAWERFVTLGLPEKTDEAFRFVSLRDFYSAMSAQDIESTACLTKEAVASAILPECCRSHLVFVDGVYSPELSDITDLPPDALLLPFPQAMRSHGPFLQAHLQKAMQEEKDPFAALSLALHASGVFLYIPPRRCAPKPVQCIYVTTQEAMRFNTSRLQIVLGAHSKLEWIATHLFLSEKRAHCSAPAMDLLCEEGAHFAFTGDLSATGKHWCFDSLRVYLKRDAHFKAVNILGGALSSTICTRQSLYVHCAGENSEADLKGLCLLHGFARAHAHTIVEHSAPHTRSMQLFKGILHDASQSSFDGKILVRPAAQKTEAYQLNNNLLLGKAAIAHSTPTLEIFADDVKASHGATVAQPSETQLFYLKSRGIGEAEAQELLLTGFYRDVLDEIPYPYLRASFVKRHVKQCEVVHG